MKLSWINEQELQTDGEIESLIACNPRASIGVLIIDRLIIWNRMQIYGSLVIG